MRFIVYKREDGRYVDCESVIVMLEYWSDMGGKERRWGIGVGLGRKGGCWCAGYSVGGGIVWGGCQRLLLIRGRM